MSIKGPRLDCGPDFLDAALIDSCRQFSRALFSLAVTVDQIPGIASRQKGKPHQFFYHVNDSIIVGGRFHAAIFFKLLSRLGNRRGVGDSEHSYPAP
ncbi:Uncharacterised protein [Serratia liquefaciens]|nr:Uncharacterised protein [Serratia liquefaciens]